MNPSASQSISGLSYTKPKDWKELTSDEKIERMREIIKYTKTNLDSANKEIWDLRHKLARHSHNSSSGKVTIEMSEYSELNSGSFGISESENLYF